MMANMETETATGTTAEATTSRQRPKRWGIVTSAARNKTIGVTIQYLVRHPKYGKYVRRRTKLHVHDENNECIIGDRVLVEGCRPLSKTKNWRLVRILEAAPRPKGGQSS